MVLDSQRGRTRSYGASPRRGMGLWPWGVLVVGVALIAVGFGGYVWPHFRGPLQHASADPQGDAPNAVEVTAGTPPTSPTTPHVTPPSPRTETPGSGAGQGVGTLSLPNRTPATRPSAPAATRPASTQTAGLLSRGMKEIELGNLIEGRQTLSQALLDPDLDPSDAQTIRDTLTSVNRSLIFSPKVAAGDPLTEAYVVQTGDYLLKFAPKYNVPYEFVETINRTPANRIRLGQKLKMVKGPFEAIVSKSAYRMDMYLPGPDGSRIYIRSFPVGLGESGSTPLGKWLVKTAGKVKNPAWTNPRTNESFAPGDPKNPIGKYWLGLEGLDDSNKSLQSYGVHGTIDPDSIGRDASMGCVRLRDDDIAMVYQMLTEGLSTVTIVP